MIQALKQFMESLEKVFPYSTMNSEVRGYHNITLDREHKYLIIGLWYKNKCYRIQVCNSDDVDFQLDEIQMWKDQLDVGLGSEIATPIQTTNDASNDPNFKGHQVIE
jgi:hypothetical protein